MHLPLGHFSNETILILESSVGRRQDNGELLVEEGETMIISSVLENPGSCQARHVTLKIPSKILKSFIDWIHHTSERQV